MAVFNLPGLPSRDHFPTRVPHHIKLQVEGKQGTGPWERHVCTDVEREVTQINPVVVCEAARGASTVVTVACEGALVRRRQKCGSRALRQENYQIFAAVSS